MDMAIDTRTHLQQLHEQAVELERLVKEFERTYYYTTGNFYPLTTLALESI